MSQLKEYSKPKLVFDENLEHHSSDDKPSLPKEEPNEYDDSFPQQHVEPVTQKTHELMEQLVNWIVEFGDDMERIVLEDQKNNPDFWFLHDKNSDTYRYFRKQVAEARNAGKSDKSSKGAYLKTSKTVVSPVIKSESSISVNEIKVPMINIDSLDAPIIDINVKSPVTNEEPQSHSDIGKSRKRKSRWGPEPVEGETPQPSSVSNGQAQAVVYFVLFEWHI